MTNVKKKDGKRFGAIVLSLILLLSLVFPYPVMADQTAADQTTAASVYAIHKQVMIGKFCDCYHG